MNLIGGSSGGVGGDGGVGVIGIRTNEDECASERFAQVEFISELTDVEPTDRSGGVDESLVEEISGLLE